MAQEARELICMITSATDDELSSVGFTIANGGITAGLKVFSDQQWRRSIQPSSSSRLRNAAS